jgi:chaperonin GroEL
MVLCERIQERITRLASGVAIIRVGASTEVEMIEKKHRIEDALEAVNSAQAEGILAGGGSALLRIGKSLSYKDWGEVMEHTEQRVAVSIMREAFKAPLQIMCINAGESFDLISQQLYEDNVVWDFTKEEVVDAFEAGILDPVRVTKNAVLNAVSVAGTLITTDYAIVEE